MGWVYILLYRKRHIIFEALGIQIGKKEKKEMWNQGCPVSSPETPVVMLLVLTIPKIRREKATTVCSFNH